jgi:YfiH family protein
LHQVHGIEVAHFDASNAGAEAEPTADAAVTQLPGLPLAILTADCLPVLFAAADGSEIGAAHAGWPGLSAGVLEATLAQLRTPPADLFAWIGPGAGPQRYEVGENVRAAFVDGDPGAAAHFVPTRPGHWLADLPALARRRLAAAGVQRVFGGTQCTISEPARWYSYRRDGATGRMASLIWINPAQA